VERKSRSQFPIPENIALEVPYNYQFILLNEINLNMYSYIYFKYLFYP
jgi:hypothetical protein